MALEAIETRIVEQHYRKARPIRGDFYLLDTGRPVFMHVGPKQGEAGYNPKQGFFVFPDKEPKLLVEKRNLIVDNASLIMSQLMAPGTSALAGGLNALAIGTGVGTGTLQNPQAPSQGGTGLYQEAYRKLIDSWTFLDANGNATATATNVIQVTINISGATIIVSPATTLALTEMGIFGGDTTTAANNTLMYNWVTFAVQNMQNTQNMTVLWTLTF